MPRGKRDMKTKKIQPLTSPGVAKYGDQLAKQKELKLEDAA
jgi:hypothetical protein